jgi:protein-disulfide isomerase
MKAFIAPLAFVVIVGCANAQTAPAEQGASQASDAVVAEVAGRKITLKEVDERWQSLNPAERTRVMQMLYQNRRNVLDQIMGDILIENAAKAANKSTADFLQEEIAKRTTPITDADVQQFFEANRDRAQGRTLDELRDPIRQFLTEQRKQQARAQLAGELSSKAGGAKVLLDPPREVVAVGPEDPVRGPANAPITIVEYSDFQCPFCARVNPTLERIRQTYGDKVRIVFKDFPLPNHPEAPKAAEAAYCAGDQGKYWEMHDRLFANQQALQVPALKQYAAALGLDTAAFDKCLDSGKHAGRVAANMEAGEALGISSTPTLYVNGRPVVGAQPFEYFKIVIDEELARSAR